MKYTKAKYFNENLFSLNLPLVLEKLPTYVVLHSVELISLLLMHFF